MADFILEEQMEHVVNKKTKEYLQEVLSSYRNKNYRSCIVVLYTTVIFDLLQKVVILKEIYNDKGAEQLLRDIKKKQEDRPTSPEWEMDLIEDIYEKTKIISAAEKEELIGLKNVRNYAAHPIINIDDDKLELKPITKETASDLLRKAFEIVFLRDAILAKNIAEDIVSDINEFYNRAETDGLEKFLNIKYFKRMTKERKDHLFKTLWKFVFILTDKECDRNRPSNYWGLVFLYKENRDHYLELIKEDEKYYSEKLELETIQQVHDKWNDIYYFKKRSRMIHIIKLLQYDPKIYTCLNDYAKNIIQQSIKHMYTDENVIDTPIWKIGNKNENYKSLFKEQVRLQADALFLSDDCQKHFEMIFNMINNYQTIRNNFLTSEDYNVLDDKDLEVIFYQCEYRGCIEEFLNFLIKYCTGAQTYWQASDLFTYLEIYKEYFEEKHYYMILTEMNWNTQFHESRTISDLLQRLEKMYRDKFDDNLIKKKEERYLYNRLYSYSDKISDYNLKELLELIEKRAIYYYELPWELEHLISDLLDDVENREILKKQKPSLYPHILEVFANKKDSRNEYRLSKFTKYFE